jgi:GNAT superfamily N-acetyltransferase
VVSGEARAAGAFAARWADLSSRVPVLRRGMGIFGLDTVVDPPRPPGALRPAGPDDGPLLRDWAHAFGRDLGLNEEEALAGVDQTLSRPGLYLWEDGGPACLVGHTAAAAGVARVGPVYTPPERRRRGYAGAATAEVSRVLVAGGIRPMLYTDLANPTSNGVYQRIGYRRIGDAAEVEFVA